MNDKQKRAWDGEFDFELVYDEAERCWRMPTKDEIRQNPRLVFPFDAQGVLPFAEGKP